MTVDRTSESDREGVWGLEGENAYAQVSTIVRVTETTVEREFTQQAEPSEGLRIQRSCRCEDSDRNWEVQSRFAFAQVCGREVDGDSAIGKSLANARDCGPDPSSAFSHRRFGKPHDVDTR